MKSKKKVRPAEDEGDDERRLWVLNDEGLYNLWRESKLSVREYVRENREMLDEVIGNVTSGRRSPHYLAYDDGRSTSAERYGAALRGGA